VYFPDLFCTTVVEFFLCTPHSAFRSRLSWLFATFNVVQDLSFLRLWRPRAPHQKFSLNKNQFIEKRWRWVILVNLMKFNVIQRTHKVLSNCISMLGFIFVVHCVWSLQVHRFNSTPADIVWFWSILGILGILEPFAFSVCLFCHHFGGRDSLKNERFTKKSNRCSLFWNWFT